MSQINLMPYVARVLAVNPAVRPLIDTLYSARAAECLAAARKNENRNHPHITGGRADQQLYALRTLAVFDVYGDEALTIRRIYRTADRRLYDLVQASPGIVSTSSVVSLLKDRTDDDWMHACILLFALLAETGKTMDADELRTGLVEYIRNSHGHKVTRPTPEERRRARRFFGADRITGIGSLFAMADDAGQKDAAEQLEVMMLTSEYAGLMPDLYTQGIALREDDLGLCCRQDKVSPWLHAALMLFCKAAAKDKAFCLSAAGKDQQAEIDTARLAQHQAEEALKAEREKTAALLDDLDAARRQNDALREQLAALNADRQELSALRSALYRAQQPDDLPDLPESRPLPLGIVGIGGVESWARAMQDAVPESRFYPAGSVTVPDSVIRSASAVWVKADYIAHKEYTRVADVARKSGVPLCYFSASSIPRCLEDLRTL